jgi:hypothetical protein
MLRTLLSAENRTLRVFQIPVSLAPLSSKGPSIAIKATLGGPLLISGGGERESQRNGVSKRTDY